MKKITLVVTTLIVFLGVGIAADCAAQAKRSKSGKGRIGLGVNLNRADVRYDLDSMSAIDGFLEFQFGSGSETFGLDETNFGIGAYYLRRMNVSKPVGTHLLAGFEFETHDVGGGSGSDFTLFGGFGVEYFLPGTNQFSGEANIGLGLHFLSEKVRGAKGTGTQLGIEDLTGGVVMLRYYFEKSK